MRSEKQAKKEQIMKALEESKYYAEVYLQLWSKDC